MLPEETRGDGASPGWLSKSKAEMHAGGMLWQGEDFRQRNPREGAILSGKPIGRTKQKPVLLEVDGPGDQRDFIDSLI